MFALCSYQTKIKLIPYHDKCKSSSCVFTCNTTQMHFKRQYWLLFLMPFVFIYILNSGISLNRFLLCIILILSVYYTLVILYICFNFCFNMEMQKVTLEQRTSKLITYLVVFGMSVVYWLKIQARFLKLKHTTHSIVMISSAYLQTYFGSTILEVYKSFHLNGYNLLRADHPNNTKRGDVASTIRSLWVSVK